MNKRIVGKIVVVLLLAAAIVGVLYLKKQNKHASQNIQNSQQKLPKLLDLGAGKCIPCKMMEPVLEELHKEYHDQLQVVFIDVWKNPKAKQQYAIELIPTQIFYDAKGKELFRHVGFFSKADIIKKWQELGINLVKKK